MLTISQPKAYCGIFDSYCEWWHTDAGAPTYPNVASTYSYLWSWLPYSLHEWQLKSYSLTAAILFVQT